MHPLSLVALGLVPNLLRDAESGGWSSRRAVSERTSGTEHSRRQRRLPRWFTGSPSASAPPCRWHLDRCDMRFSEPPPPPLACGRCGAGAAGRRVCGGRARSHPLGRRRAPGLGAGPSSAALRDLRRGRRTTSHLATDYRRPHRTLTRALHLPDHHRRPVRTAAHSTPAPLAAGLTLPVIRPWAAATGTRPGRKLGGVLTAASAVISDYEAHNPTVITTFGSVAV